MSPLPPDSVAPGAEQLAALVSGEQQQRWEKGERLLLETYLERHPALRADSEALLDLIYAEVCLREQFGEQPTLEEYLRRFPTHALALERQFILHRALQSGVLLEVAETLHFPAPVPPPAEDDTLSSDGKVTHPSPEDRTAVVLPAEGEVLPSEDLDPDAVTLPPPLADAVAPAGGSPAPLTAARPHPQTDTTVAAGLRIPGYELLGELGRGGMGVVYKARQTHLNRTVALKMILGGVHAGGAERQRFLSEAKAVAHLQHPHIVQIHEVGEVGGNPFFSLEFCPGGSLANRLDGTPLLPQQAAQLVEVVAHAMHAAHQQGIVHRDLKPANILFVEGPDTPLGQSTPKITDFGLAKKLDDPAGPTASGSIMGTPSYMAPEQARGKSLEIGPPTDVYALGAILYELLTGRPPFKGATPLETMYQLLHHEPVAPRGLQPRVPHDLETICLKCLHKERKRRYASAAALAEDLRRFQKGEPIQARPVGPVERCWRWGRRNRAVAALVGAVALTLMLGTAVASFFAVEANARARVARQAQETAGRRLYVSDLRLAEQAWAEGQGDRLLELLEGQRPEHTGGLDLRGFEWHYWWRAAHAELLTLRGHTGRVLAVAIDPSGSRIASAGEDGSVRLWDAQTGQAVLTLAVDGGAVQSLAFSPDGKLLAGAVDSGDVLVWDTTASQPPRVLPGHKRGAGSVAFSPDGTRLASAGDDSLVRVWDTQTGQALLTLKGHVGPVLAVAFSADGKSLASGGFDGTLRLWDAQAGGQTLLLTGHKGPVQGVVFAPDGAGRLASAGFDHTVRVWDSATGREVLSLQEHTWGVSGVAFSPDGRRLASAGGDGTVRLWDARTGQEAVILRGHADRVNGVAFGPDGRRLASAGDDGSVRLWDAQAGYEAHPLKGHAEQAYCACFNRDATRLASVSKDLQHPDEAGEVRLWDPSTGTALRTLPGHSGAIWTVAFSPDGTLVAGAGVDGTVRLWEAETGHEVGTLSGHEGPVCCVAFNADGTRLASASADRTVRVWSVLTRKRVLLLEGHEGPFRSVTFRRDGWRLATADGDGVVRVWDALSGQELFALRGHTRGVGSVAFSPDGTRLASTGWDEVRVWDAQTGQHLFTLKGHTDVIRGVCFSPDGKRLATASEDRSVRLWDLLTGQEVLTLRGQAGAIISLTFTPDGRRLASVSQDGTVQVWDATPREP